jgi:hypothetical protein
VADKRLAAGDRRLLTILVDYVNPEGTSYTSMGSIARSLGTSRSYISRIAQKLQRLGYMTIQPRHGPHGGQSSNLFCFNFSVSERETCIWVPAAEDRCPEFAAPPLQPSEVTEGRTPRRLQEENQRREKERNQSQRVNQRSPRAKRNAMEPASKGKKRSRTFHPFRNRGSAGSMRPNKPATPPKAAWMRISAKVDASHKPP